MDQDRWLMYPLPPPNQAGPRLLADVSPPPRHRRTRLNKDRQVLHPPPPKIQMGQDCQLMYSAMDDYSADSCAINPC